MHQGEAPEPEVWRVGDLLVDVGRQTVTRAGAEIPLPRLSFDLLLALVRGAPNLLSTDQLMSQVWPGVVVSPETLVQRVKLLREALDKGGGENRYVLTLRGRGYRLVSEVRRLRLGQEVPDTTPPASAPTSREAAGSGEPPMGSHPDARPRAAMRRWAPAALMLLALAVPLGMLRIARAPTTVAAVSGDSSGQGAAPAAALATERIARTVAVLPFRNLSAATDDAWHRRVQ